MKCAIELLAMNSEALDYKARAHERAVARSIQFCEDVITPLLEKWAKTGDLPIKYSNTDSSLTFMTAYTSTGTVDGGDIAQLYFDGTTYANGEKSYDWRNEWLDKEAIIAYCAKHCIEARFTDHWFKRYGSGDKKGTRIYLRVMPSCMG